MQQIKPYLDALDADAASYRADDARGLIQRLRYLAHNIDDLMDAPPQTLAESIADAKRWTEEDIAWAKAAILESRSLDGPLYDEAMIQLEQLEDEFAKAVLENRFPDYEWMKMCAKAALDAMEAEAREEVFDAEDAHARAVQEQWGGFY